MNGPEHYLEAERLLIEARDFGDVDGRPAAEALLAAQVHATLSLTAATALGARSFEPDERPPTPAGMALADFRAWDEVCGQP